jgi:hypothetical protein
MFLDRASGILTALALSLMSLSACDDESLRPTPLPSPDPATSSGTYIVDVNLRTHQVTSYPAASAHPPDGVDLSLFGGTGTVSHLFELVGSAPSAGNTYILRDHLENVFSYAIGTNVAHSPGALPRDTMGIFVFLSIQPFGIVGCTPGPACQVRADSGYDGAFQFTGSTPQQYMYFKTILEPSDGTAHRGPDYTDQSPANGGSGIDYYRSFAFRASPAVTDFRFGVAVSAAKVKPNDNRWKVTYVGDSLPARLGASLTDLRSEPDWRVSGNAGAVADTSILTTGCAGGAARCLRIQSTTPSLLALTDSISFSRSDSVGASDSAYIAATVAVTNLPATNGAPSVFLGLQDRTKLISFGISQNSVGLCNASNAFLSGGTVTMDPTTVGSWRISKFASDSVVVYANGTRLLKQTYTSLPAAPALASTPYFWFGNRVSWNLLFNPTNVTSLWSSVVYEIGATQ